MKIESAPAPVRSLFDTGDLRLSYSLRGHGPPVVFIQGVGLHGDGWLPQTEALADGFTCLSFDNPGMGSSLPIPDELTVPSLAEGVLSLLDHVGWASAHFVGHSLGSLVAIEAASLAPGRVRSLALLCSVVRGRDATRATWPVIRLGLASMLGSKRAARRAFLRLTTPPAALAAADPDALAAELEPLFGHDLAEQPPVVDLQLKALREYDASPRLSGLRNLPALVLSASQDPIAPPRYGRELSELLDAEFVVIDEAAHGVTISHTGEVNRLLRENLSRAEKPAGDAASTAGRSADRKAG